MFIYIIAMLTVTVITCIVIVASYINKYNERNVVPVKTQGNEEFEIDVSNVAWTVAEDGTKYASISYDNKFYDVTVDSNNEAVITEHVPDDVYSDDYSDIVEPEYYPLFCNTESFYESVPEDDVTKLYFSIKNNYVSLSSDAEFISYDNATHNIAYKEDNKLYTLIWTDNYYTTR